MQRFDPVQMLTYNAAGLVFVLLILVVVSLILREFWCWYWKINQMVGLLREVKQLLAGRESAKEVASQSAGEAEALGPGI